MKAKTTGKEILGYVFFRGRRKNDELTRRINKKLANLVKTNAVDSSNTTTLANLLNYFQRNKLSLRDFSGNKLEINVTTPQKVLEK